MEVFLIISIIYIIISIKILIIVKKIYNNCINIKPKNYNIY